MQIEGVIGEISSRLCEFVTVSCDKDGAVGCRTRGRRCRPCHVVHVQGRQPKWPGQQLVRESHISFILIPMWHWVTHWHIRRPLCVSDFYATCADIAAIKAVRAW